MNVRQLTPNSISVINISLDIIFDFFSAQFYMLFARVNLKNTDC